MGVIGPDAAAAAGFAVAATGIAAAAVGTATGRGGATIVVPGGGCHCVAPVAGCAKYGWPERGSKPRTQPSGSCICGCTGAAVAPIGAAAIGVAATGAADAAARAAATCAATAAAAAFAPPGGDLAAFFSFFSFSSFSFSSFGLTSTIVGVRHLR